MEVEEEEEEAEEGVAARKRRRRRRRSRDVEEMEGMEDMGDTRTEKVRGSPILSPQGACEGWELDRKLEGKEREAKGVSKVPLGDRLSSFFQG